MLERADEYGPGLQVPSPYGLDDRSPIGWLLNRALLVRADWFTAEVPREVGLVLRGGRAVRDFLPASPLLATEPADPAQLDAEATAAALRIVADIGVLLDTWDERPPKLLKDGGAGVREVRRVAQAIGRDEPGAAVVIELAARAGLVGAADDGESGHPTEESDAWRQLEVARRWSWLAEAWLATPAHVSLAGATGTNDKPIPPMLELRAEPVAVLRRRAVLSALASVAASEAPTAASLRAAVQWAQPHIWTGGPTWPDGLVDWVVSEAAMLGLTERGALSYLGRHVAADLRGGPATAADALAAHAPRLSSTIVIQGDLTAIGAGELEATVRAELELVADVESKGAATVYRFSEASVRRAFDAGRTAAHVEEFLDAHAPKGVPQALRYLIADVGRRHGSLRVGEAVSYVRSDDPALLAEACRARKLARLGLRLLAPTVAVSTAPAPQVVDALRAAGYLPAEEDPSGVALTTDRGGRRAPPLLPGPLPSRDAVGPDAAETARNLTAAGIGPLPDAPPPGVGCETAAPRPAPSVLFPHDGGEVDWAGFAAALDAYEPGAERPTAIRRDQRGIVELLEQAEAEEWLVRLSYLNNKGTENQVTAEVLIVARGQVTVAVVPSWVQRTLAVAWIRWARVLTEAEEEVLA
ncbi:MAG TPA: helicase-associated domain-containing protein [Acidimicrobiales bacterium]|nr:helicase-associated domain-containing protein [Acidimicrobiales bacterium]